jgi:hypothetical protein
LSAQRPNGLTLFNRPREGISAGWIYARPRTKGQNMTPVSTLIKRDKSALREPEKARSRVSNHADLLPAIVDGRSAPARRFRDLVNAFVVEMGGLDRCSKDQIGRINRRPTGLWRLRPRRKRSKPSGRLDQVQSHFHVLASAYEEQSFPLPLVQKCNRPRVERVSSRRQANV